MNKFSFLFMDVFKNFYFLLYKIKIKYIFIKNVCNHLYYFLLILLKINFFACIYFGLMYLFLY